MGSRVKRLLLLLLLSVGVAYAEGPIYRHKDAKIQQEFENIYKDSRVSVGRFTTVLAGPGSVGSPAFSFPGDTNTGMFQNTDNILALAANGVVLANYRGDTTPKRIETQVAIHQIAGTESLPSYTFQDDADSGFYRYGANTPAVSAAGAISMLWDASAVNVYTSGTLKYQFGPTEFTPNATTKTQDLGLATQAWDDAYADDFNNVADIPFFDFVKDKHGTIVEVDDLAVIRNIKPLKDGSGKIIFNDDGHAYWDDSTLPEWVFKHDEKTGDLVKDPDGKPWISMKVLAGLALGASGQLIKEVDALKATVATQSADIAWLKEELSKVKAK